jgi:hypothetical protein
MSRIDQKAKLSPGLFGVKSPAPDRDEFVVSISANGASERPGPAPAIPIPSLALDPDGNSTPEAGAVLAGEHMLFKKGAATARAFRPSYWAYDRNNQEGDARRDPLPLAIPEPAPASTLLSALPAGETNHATEAISAATFARATENRAAQQALAASLAEIIESILCTQRFAARRQA